MNEEERRLWKQMIDLQRTHIDRLQRLMYWCVALFILISGMFTFITVNATYQHRAEVTSIVEDYFTTDYDYGTIEQNVEVRTDNENE